MDDVTPSSARVKGLTVSYSHILHHGAIAGVTGSCHRLRMDERHSLLVDCGLLQGAEVSPEGGAGVDNLAIDFSLSGIQTLVVIDHVGRIPYLLAAGFKGPILYSEPSAKLLPIVLEDAFKLGFTRDQQQAERYLELLEQRIIALPYDVWFTLVDTELFKGRNSSAVGGMCAGGRIVEYLKAMLHDARHDALLVGYQARGTLGHAIQTHGSTGGYVLLDGVRHNISARIHTIAGYSAHADQQGLLDFVACMDEWPSEIRIVHGDPEAKCALAARYQVLYRQEKVEIPEACRL